MGFGAFGNQSLSFTPANTARNTIRPLDIFTPGVTVTVPNGFATTAYDTFVEGEDYPRTRLRPGGVLLGAGAADPEALLERLAPVGTSTVGALAQNGVRLSRLGWFNVKDYGAVGNGSADDRAAIQAAIDAAAVPAGGGIVFFPPGKFMVDCTTAGLVLPNSKHIILRGCAAGIGGFDSVSRIMRSAGTATLIRNATPTGDERFNGQVENLDIHGNNATGRIVHIVRSGGRFQGLRITGSATTGVTAAACQFEGAWNMSFIDVNFFALGANTTHPACRFTEATGAWGAEGTNTVNMTNCVWEHNFGTDLELTGGTLPSVGVVVTNSKLERGKTVTAGSTWPFIHFKFCRNNSITGSFITVGGASPCDLIRQDDVNARGNVLNGMCLEHQGGVGGLYFMINHVQGSMAATGCHFDNWATQLGASWRIASTVPRYGAAGYRSNTFHTTSARTYLDQRTVASPGAGNGPEGL